MDLDPSLGSDFALSLVVRFHFPVPKVESIVGSAKKNRDLRPAFAVAEIPAYRARIGTAMLHAEFISHD